MTRTATSAATYVITPQDAPAVRATLTWTQRSALRLLVAEIVHTGGVVVDDYTGLGINPATVTVLVRAGLVTRTGRNRVRFTTVGLVLGSAVRSTPVELLQGHGLLATRGDLSFHVRLDAAA